MLPGLPYAPEVWRSCCATEALKGPLESCKDSLLCKEFGQWLFSIQDLRSLAPGSHCFCGFRDTMYRLLGLHSLHDIFILQDLMAAVLCILTLTSLGRTATISVIP